MKGGWIRKFEFLGCFWTWSFGI